VDAEGEEDLEGDAEEAAEVEEATAAVKEEGDSTNSWTRSVARENTHFCWFRPSPRVLVQRQT
jgi:hypothetical protein